MKKIISVLLTLALVLSLVPAVFAADEPTFSLSADKETAGAGDTVTLTVSFSNNGAMLEIGGLNFEIIYDEEAYTFVSATPAKAYRPYFPPVTKVLPSVMENSLSAVFLRRLLTIPLSWKMVS